MFKLNIKKQIHFPQSARTTLNELGEKFETIGTKVLRALSTNEKVSDIVSVTYDESDVNGVDVMTSAKHDFFDIAEEFGEIIEDMNKTPEAVTPRTIEEIHQTTE